MGKDKVFSKKMDNIQPFEFNKEVADVFDDMLDRSVPFYAESIRRQAKMASYFYQGESNIYDLGCSNGNLGLLILDCFSARPFKMIGVDSSEPMIEMYDTRLKKKQNSHLVTLACDIIENINILNASVVIINLTLQFVDTTKRDMLIQKIYDGLLPGGVLLLTEKIVCKDDEFNTAMNHFYKEFKLENGYSELEISQKRDALEKVLIPETVETHKNRILKSGFNFFDIWMQWFNFASMVGIKK